MAAIRHAAESATGVPGTTVPRRLPQMRTRRRVRADIPYINRELSWLEFNDRVLQLAEDESQPLIERLKFLAIFVTNLDEFFMIRVAGVHDQVDARIDARGPDGLSPTRCARADRRARSRAGPSSCTPVLRGDPTCAGGGTASGSSHASNRGRRHP